MFFIYLLTAELSYSFTISYLSDKCITADFMFSFSNSECSQSLIISEVLDTIATTMLYALIMVLSNGYRSINKDAFASQKNGEIVMITMIMILANSFKYSNVLPLIVANILFYVVICTQVYVVAKSAYVTDRLAKSLELVASLITLSDDFSYAATIRFL